jgi:hypothetical protein
MKKIRLKRKQVLQARMLRRSETDKVGGQTAREPEDHLVGGSKAMKVRAAWAVSPASAESNTALASEARSRENGQTAFEKWSKVLQADIFSPWNQ